KNQPRDNLGDCVDCRMCVQVCPTGIDIRNGTQLECVNCTACIDACNSVMDRVGLPRGLIRYSSYNSIAEGTGFRLTPRIIGYSAVLILLLTTLVTLLLFRAPIESTILRTPGVLYQVTDDGYVRNLYNFIVVNKTMYPQEVFVRLKDLPGNTTLVTGKRVTVPPAKLAESAFFVDIPRSHIRAVKTPIEIEVYTTDSPEPVEIVKTAFMGPAPEGRP
ncbi:MAG: cytochrome c oxidase accessory protein CcoG, partial [Calditrichaeota bacterium]